MNTPFWIPYAAFCVSIIAILCSILSLLLSYSNYRRDRFRLQFTGALLTTTEDNDFSYAIYIEAVNVGRRPISVTDIYFSTDPNRSEFPIHTPIHGFSADSVHPVELKENETTSFKSKSMARKEMLELAEVIVVVIKDSANNHYRVSIDNEAYDD